MRNWENVLPEIIAMQQHAWERKRRIMSAIDAGATISEMAKKLNLSYSRTRQIYLNAKRTINEKTPLELYLQSLPWEKCQNINQYHYVCTHTVWDAPLNIETFQSRKEIRRCAKEFNYGIRFIK